jgi:TPR repeat protein
MYENIKAGKYANKVLWPIRDSYASLADFNKAKKEYRAGEMEAKALFKKDLLEGYGVQNHSKADKAYQIAWEHGHSSGYYEVVNYFEELVELLK